MEVSMWRSRLITLIVWAAGTFALALACGIPAVSDAVNDSGASGWTTNILNPRLTINGIEFTVTTADPATPPRARLSNPTASLRLWCAR
jgi:hypothetical protein